MRGKREKRRREKTKQRLEAKRGTGNVEAEDRG